MQIITPDLGVDSATVGEILVKVGDVVGENDTVLVAESDKASVDVPAGKAGAITSVLVNTGDTIAQGAPLFEVQVDGQSAAHQESVVQNDAIDNLPKDNTQATTHTDSAPTLENSMQTFALPDLGVESALVAEVVAQEGDEVGMGDTILLVESDKASVEVPAPIAGKIVQILVKAGDSVAQGQEFVQISGQAPQVQTQVEMPTQSVQNENTQKPKTGTQTAVSTQANTLDEDSVNAAAKDAYAGPAVRKMARQMGVDIGKIKGSQSNGRIIKEDLFAFVKNALQGGGASGGGASIGAMRGLPNLPDMSNAEIWGATEVLDLSRLQKVSIPQLNYNTLLPQVTQFDLADITDTEHFRGTLKDDFKKQGIGLTILAFIAKAAAHALQENPKFNSHLSDDNTQIIVRKAVHIGIAVATDDGLIVPVLKDVQNKGIKQIAKEIGELASKARDKKLSAKELQGASFTISSQGNLGGTYFTPLVNWPQVAILGVSEASMQPRYNGKEFEPRLMLPLSLSYDHRVINGADAAVFTRHIANLLADPRKILL